MPTRRTILKAAALAPLSAPFVRGAFAAGKLAVAAEDRPGAGGRVLQQICTDWAAQQKIDLTFDLVGAGGGKYQLTLMAEAAVRTGHDIVGLPAWGVATQQHSLAPVDALIASLIQQNGAVAPGCEYLANLDGHWRAVPGGYASKALPSCARIDYLNQYAGIDVQAMYPGPDGPPNVALQDEWTWDNFLAAAAACAGAGHFFALGISPCPDAEDWVGAMFAAQGVQLVDKDGNVAVDSDATRQALEWFRKLAKTLPAAVFSYDDAANDKALLAGDAALIFNAPDAYEAASRTAPEIAAQLWTFPAPKGPQGRFDPADYHFWGIWNFSNRIAPATALLAHLATREVQAKLVAASAGTALPPFAGGADLDYWQQAGPPPGTLYNYPPRGDATGSVAGFPAPPAIAARLYRRATATRMIALCTKEGKSVDEAIAFAEKEIASFLRS